MNYDKKGNIKHIEYEDITYQSQKCDEMGRPQYQTTEADWNAVLDILNEIIDEINELKK